MIKSIKMLGLTIVAVLAFSAVAAASASAAKFHASKAPGEAVSTNDWGEPAVLHAQTFTTSIGTVVCKMAEGKGTIEHLESETQKMKVKYTECTYESSVFGKGPAEVSETEYEFHSNGTVNVLNTVTIKAICNITVKPQGPLSAVEYSTVAGPPRKILEKSKVTGIAYESACGSGTNGTYTGENLVEEVGGEAWFE